MASERAKAQTLALQAALKVTTQLSGRGAPKIGVEEFLSLAERFGISAEARRKIKGILAKEKTWDGPFLANYFSGLKETKVQAFEKAAREIFGVKYAIAVSSGTGALHAALVAVGVGPGKEVICPAVGFIATSAAVVMAKGVPIFCDVDESLSIDPTKIEALISKRTAAIIPTHVMGSVCNMAAIMKVARKHKLKVVEDCAQSCGGKFKGRWVGTIGDVGCFSISAYKTVGGGEGGLLLTNKKRLWERASQLAEGGGLWRPDRFAKPRYDAELFAGTNYRLSELEAAVDVVQLRKVKAMVKRFQTTKSRVLQRLKTYREILPQLLNDADGEVGYLLRFYPSTVKLAERIVKELQSIGIECSTRGKNPPPDWHQYSYMYPIVMKRSATNDGCPFACPIYERQGGAADYSRSDCPVADDLFDLMVTIKLNQWFTAKDCRTIADGLNTVLSSCCTEDPKAAKWIT